MVSCTEKPSTVNSQTTVTIGGFIYPSGESVSSQNGSKVAKFQADSFCGLGAAAVVASFDRIRSALLTTQLPRSLPAALRICRIFLERGFGT